jgi:transcriptional regulator with XRE-family HTH domain
VVQSSISQHLEPAGRLSKTLDPDLRRALGRQLRRLRTDRELTQGELGAPLTRAYVSAVEAGRTVPSLPALQLMVDRLDVPLSTFFEAVERELTGPYDGGHDHHHPDASARRS